ncbi:MAG: PIG-L family deacetylase [Verrucomicrobia bacterium]|nr:PIG-L family deacetylase [Verrucomicrobiota bacterium]
MNILIAAAHPDDEVLGIGASIARWVREGHQVSVLFFTDGVGARGRNTAAAKIRKKAAQKVAATLGFSIAGFGKFPDNQLDSVPLLKIVQTIEHAKKKFLPELVYTHFWGDLNVDHRLVLEAVLTAFRPKPGEKCRSIQCFEVASATEWGSPAAAFRPNNYIEVSAEDVKKALHAYKAYTREVQADPHIRSVEAFLARRALRGREVGYEWAEGLMQCRQLDPLPA